MADEIDQIQESQEIEIAALIAQAAKPVPVGAPGICDECAEHSKRLVGGRCAPCRDGRN